MYSLVLRQLNPIQKGVQTAHAVAEYVSLYNNKRECEQWVKVDKTLIILDGGTSPEMESLVVILNDIGIDFALFKEPDLNDLTTSICFIVDEEKWNEIDEEFIESRESFTETERKYIVLKDITQKCKLSH